MSGLPFFLVLLLLHGYHGETIRSCVQCSTEGTVLEDTCDNTVIGNINSTRCPTGFLICRKLVTVSTVGTEPSYVGRECAQSCVESSTWYGMGTSIYCCTADGCNGGVSHFLSVWTMAGASLVSTMMILQ